MSRVKSYARTSYSETTVTVDKESGEIVDLDSIRHRFIANGREEFFLGYISLLGMFKDLSGPCIRLYSFLLERYKPGTPIVINLSLKNIIGKDLKLKSSTINNALSELVNRRLLFRPEGTRGIYYLNPRYAFKGSTSDRNGSLLAIIELGCNDC